MFGYDLTGGRWYALFCAILFALVLGYVLHRQRLKTRRRRSLKRDDSGGYVWIEMDGTTGRSRDNPSDRWNAQDAADADGDGGGD